MLVISRNVGERLLLMVHGELIVIENVETRRDKQRLGITASDAVVVFREEIAPSDWQEAASAIPKKGV